MVDLIFNRIKTARIDWLLVASILPLFGAGLLTMHSFTVESYYFERQLIWIVIGLTLLFAAALVDWRFLRNSFVVLSIYLTGCLSLVIVFLMSHAIRAVNSWFSVGGVSLQPAEFMKLVVIIILAKYFTRRHIEINRIRHIILSGFYTFIPFVLILIQPDFGSAMIIFLIWLGMVIVAGISKKHLLAIFGVGAVAFSCLWLFAFAPYQKARIMTFISPLSDIRGAGYNAFQSTVAAGSGQIFGKGVGFGSQSRLKFLPEFQTDFIFAAFAEEWGFIGVLLIFILYSLIIWRILTISSHMPTNFETLFGVGLAILIMSHFVIHVGMNIGLLPVTGIPVSFLSYGGSHLLTICLGIGMLLGMRRHSLSFHRGDIHNEFVGPR